MIRRQKPAIKSRVHDVPSHEDGQKALRLQKQFRLLVALTHNINTQLAVVRSMHELFFEEFSWPSNLEGKTFSLSVGPRDISKFPPGQFATQLSSDLEYLDNYVQRIVGRQVSLKKTYPDINDQECIKQFAESLVKLRGLLGQYAAARDGTPLPSFTATYGLNHILSSLPDNMFDLTARNDWTPKAVVDIIKVTARILDLAEGYSGFKLTFRGNDLYLQYGGNEEKIGVKA